jgi:hypothetical protein
MRIWFMPTGWRPADVAEKYPVYKIDDVYNFEKYNPESSKALQTWSFIQLFILLGFISYLFGNLATIGSPGIFLYGLFIFAYIYAMTELMDGNPIAYVWEGIKLVIGVYLIINTNGWFGAEKLFQYIPHIVFTYLLAAMYLSINLSIKRKVSVPSESSVS